MAKQIENTRPEGALSTVAVEKLGMTLFSRWVRTGNGAILVLIRRTEEWREGWCVSLTVLDVAAEKAIEVSAEDWQRWMNTGKVARYRSSNP